MKSPEGPISTERTIPILPCRSIDDVLAFYRTLGFEVTYRQERPNTFAVVQRGGIELQFFVLKGLDPANSYSTCYVLTSDVDSLHAAFTDQLRAALGRVPSRGIPRIGALREMPYGVRQFIVVDPGGNYIRIGQPTSVLPKPRAETATRLERSLVAAIDSSGLARRRRGRREGARLGVRRRSTDGGDHGHPRAHPARGRGPPPR